MDQKKTTQQKGLRSNLFQQGYKTKHGRVHPRRKPSDDPVIQK